MLGGRAGSVETDGKGAALGRTLRVGPTGRGGLVGIVFFLAIAAAALGGCGDTASSPLVLQRHFRCGCRSVSDP